MGICPLCNGFESLSETCKTCHQMMEDKGRIIDYFDDYSPYMEIDDMKKIDGFQNTYEEQRCAHLIFCPNCHQDNIYFVQE